MSVTAWLERARSFVTVELWSDREPHGRPRLIRLLQFSIMVVQGFVRDHLMLRASGLAYFTVLSVVPLLAVAVSIAGAVGVRSEGFVDQVVGMLAAVSPQAQETIRQLIRGANFTGLGTLSAVVLFVTTVLAIGSIEKAFNGIWGVSKARPWSRRFSDYLAVLVVGPLLGGAALSFTTSLKSQWVLQRLLENPAFARLLHVGLSQVPGVMLTLVFAFLYWFLPNTRVRPLSALIGAVPAALMTLAAQSLYVDFSIGAARASMFFGSFSALALLFVWIYAFWAIVLFGSEISFAHQTLHVYRRELRSGPAGGAEREAIGLRVAVEVGRRFRDAAAPIDAGALSDTLNTPVRVVRDVVERLCEARILSQHSEKDEQGLQLGRPAERIQVIDVLEALRGTRESSGGDPSVTGAVQAVLSELEESAVKAAAGRTLADLLEGVPPVAEATGHVDRKPASG